MLREFLSKHLHVPSWLAACELSENQTAATSVVYYVPDMVDVIQ